MQDLPTDGKCQRCRQPTNSTMMSMFCPEMICDTCQKIERNHPDFEKARKAEAEAVKMGNYNFPGIGKPADL